MTMGYYNGIAIANLDDNKKIVLVVKYFIFILIAISIIVFSVVYIYAEKILKILNSNYCNPDTILVLSVLVMSLLFTKSFINPLNAFLNLKGSVKSYFIYVSIPLLCAILIIFSVSSFYYGIVGIAFGNLVVAVFWVVLVFIEIHKYSTLYPGIIKLYKI